MQPEPGAGWVVSCALLFSTMASNLEEMAPNLNLIANYVFLLVHSTLLENVMVAVIRWMAWPRNHR